MNSEWAPWGLTTNGNTKANHKLFWQHVVNRFRADGVTNVSWVWTPNVRYGGDLSSYAEMYPGDSYVDYVGLDGYNWGGSRWQTFSQVFDQSYNEMTSLTSKNILIMEIGSSELGGNKASWITDMFNQLSTKYTRIKGFTWFNENKENDWRIESSTASKNAFSTAVKNLAVATTPTTQVHPVTPPTPVAPTPVTPKPITPTPVTPPSVKPVPKPDKPVKNPANNYSEKKTWDSRPDQTIDGNHAPSPAIKGESIRLSRRARFYSKVSSVINTFFGTISKKCQDSKRFITNINR
jgi:hypothetical protein